MHENSLKVRDSLSSSPPAQIVIISLFFFLPRSLSVFSMQLCNRWIYIRFFLNVLWPQALSVKITSVELPLSWLLVEPFLIGILEYFTLWSGASSSWEGEGTCFSSVTWHLCYWERASGRGDPKECRDRAFLCWGSRKAENSWIFCLSIFLKLGAHRSPLDGSRRPSGHTHPSTKTLATELLAEMILGFENKKEWSWWLALLHPPHLPI